MKTRHFGLIGFIFLLLLAGCGGGKSNGPVKREVIRGITTLKLEPTQVDAYYETSGTVRAKTVSLVASRVMGAVISIKVKEGDRVNSGDILLLIDNHDTLQRVAAAEAGFHEVQKARDAAEQQRSFADVTYRRYKNLFDEKVITQQEYDQIETQKKVADAGYEQAVQAVEHAKANLEEARAYNEYTRVKAPLSGVVSEKKIEPGSMAMPGVPLFTVEDTSHFKIEVGVDEELTGKFTPGMEAVVLLEKDNRKLTGKITKVVPSIDPSTRTFLIEIDLPGDSLRTGLYGKVLIPRGKKEALLVPVAAMIERGQLTGVFVVDDKGIVAYRLIKAGRTYDGRLEVLSGLSNGEQIIVSGVEKAFDGGIVEQ